MDKGKLLVLVQFALICAIFFTGPYFPAQRIYMGLYLLGVFIGLAAVIVMQKSKLRITPDVAHGSTLVKEGPYKYIRHPMYTGLLLVTAALVLDYFSIIRLGYFVFLLANLLLKLKYEEQLLTDAFKRYRKYMEDSWRLIPFVY